jgi:DNA-binding transcriptional ArsR family regulator
MLLIVRFRGGSMTSGEIAERFAHAWATTVRHLKVLENAKLLIRRKEGRVVHYELNVERLALVHEWLEWLKPPSKAETHRKTQRARPE